MLAKSVSSLFSLSICRLNFPNSNLRMLFCYAKVFEPSTLHTGDCQGISSVVFFTCLYCFCSAPETFQEWQATGPRRLALLKKWVQSSGDVAECTLMVITEHQRLQCFSCLISDNEVHIVYFSFNIDFKTF